MTEISWYRRRLAVVGLLLMVAQSVGAQLDGTLAKAQQLVEARQAQAAYEMLVPQVDQRAGDPAFDYVFALACLDTGHVTEGVFALERVLAVDPGHPQARAELARAYLLLGELDAARAEFEAVKRSSPPKPVESLIDNYLAEIDRRQGGDQDTRVSGFVSFTVGYDSNVSSANDSFDSLSTFGTRFAFGAEQSDTFGQVTGGASIYHRLGPQMALIANAVLTQRWNQSERRFDTGNGYGDIGIVWQRDQEVFTVAVQGSRFMLNRDRYRDTLGVSGQWRHIVDGSTSFTTFAQATGLDFGDDQWPGNQVRNANRYILGGNLIQDFGGRFKPTMTLGLYGGTQRIRASGLPEGFGYSFVGFSGSLQAELQPKLTGFVNAAVERRNYRSIDPVYFNASSTAVAIGIPGATILRRERGDTFFRISGGLSYEFAKDWLAIPRAYYSRDSSNLNLYDYDRVLVSMTLRRNFQ